MNVLFSVLLSFLSASATLDKSGHLMFVEYSINESTKDEGVIYVDILFHYKGETYKVARHRYPEPITSIVDTFPWVSKDKWEGGDLEVVAKRADGGVEKSYISEQSIAIRDLGYEPPKSEHEVNSALVKIDDGPDPYAWRMLGYDPGHTGYYPFSLYPPLDSLWMYDWSGAGSWTAEISGCAGHDMLFIPLAPWGWNRIAAFDVENGDTIWQRVLTSNVWTSALSSDDSTLFVGTSIGFTPWKDTTFYALDPFTGKLKWGKSLKTVEYSPIVVDTFVYAPHFYKVYCFTYGGDGDSLWAANGAYSSPVYDNGIIVGASTDSVLTARDWLTGRSVWDFVEDNPIYSLTIYQHKVLPGVYGYIPAHALDVETGYLIWENNETFYQIPHGAYSKIFWGHGIYANGGQLTVFKWLNASDGQNLHEVLLSPSDTSGSRMIRMLITQDSILWVANVDILYFLKISQQIPFDTLLLPQSPAIFASWGFPIAYKNHYIYAHEDFLIVYRTDTSNCRDSTPASNSTGILYSPDGQIVFHFVSQKSSPFSLGLYTIDGRKVWELHEPLLPAGTYNLNLPELPHSGVYILRYSFSNLTGAERFIYIKRR